MFSFLTMALKVAIAPDLVSTLEPPRSGCDKLIVFFKQGGMSQAKG